MLVSKTWLVCDLCRIESPPGESSRIVRDTCHHAGWFVGHTRGQQDRCPDCQRNYRELVMRQATHRWVENNRRG